MKLLSDKLETGKECLNTKVFVADHYAAVDDDDDDDGGIGRFRYISFYFIFLVRF